MESIVLPKIVEHYLSHYWVTQRHLAYFYFDQHEILQDFGGDFAFYFPEGIGPGMHATDLSAFLAAIIPFEEDEFSLPYVEMRDDLYINIHILNDRQQQRYCVLFLNISEEVANEERIQQAKNELHLLTEKYKKLMRRHVGDPVVNKIIQGQTALNRKGERKTICTMFIDVRGFTVFNESHDSQEVIDTLNQYLKIMIQAVLDQGGIIDKIVGDGLMVLFGVLPVEHRDNYSAPQAAFDAAKRIQFQVHNLIVERKKQQLPALGVGIGIAMGSAVLGILGDEARQTFTAIGHHVNLAQRLESHARAGEILLDESSFAKICSDQHQIAPIELHLKGIRGVVRAYSFQSSLNF